MITLHLIGFRCYEQEETFTFMPGEIIRIRGRSGIGKTTLFEAIQWLLYNYPTANIYPRHGKVKNTSVTLTLPWSSDGKLVIARKKNPCLLVVTHPNGHQEEDDVAQATIDSLFGSRDIWRTCCYLPQGENCPLLGFSNTQRMEILEALAFLNEKPEDDLDKISDEIHRLQAEFNLADHEFHRLENEFEAFSLLNNPEDSLIDDETHQMALTRQEEIKKRIATLEQQYFIVGERKKQRQLIDERLRKSQRDLEKLPDVDPSKIVSLEAEIKELQNELPLSQQGEAKHRLEVQHQALLGELEKLPIPDREYTQEEYQESFSLEKKIADEQRLVQRWQIKYQPEIIKGRINQIKSLLDGQKEAQVWSRITSLQKKLDALTGPDVSQEDLEKGREELKSLERSVDVHKCPACKRSLRYLRGNLVLSETSPVPADKIKKLKEVLAQMEIAYRESHEREILTIQLDSLLSTVAGEVSTIHLLKPAEIKKLEQEMVELGRLVFPDPPKISSHEIREAQEYFRLRKELHHLEEELARYPQLDHPLRKTNELLKQLNTCQKTLKQLQDITSRREMLTNQMKILLQDLSNLPPLEEGNIKTELDRLRTEEKEIKLAFEDDQLARDYLNLEKKYRQQVADTNQLNTALGATLRLKDLAHREVCAILEEKIKSINLAIAEACNKIFVEPITVELAMLKTTKTTKITKPCVHLKIWYKDAEYDSLSQLSGGEGKRVSIAVSLSLAQLNNFPMILLDECLNGLDEELKEMTLEILREMSGGKTILCIMHDGIEGYYDKVMSLDEQK